MCVDGPLRQVIAGVGLSDVRREGTTCLIICFPSEVEVIVTSAVVAKGGVIDERSKVNGGTLQKIESACGID